jgi:glycine/D-amino acid oxidase-like deaminating enzyme
MERHESFWIATADARPYPPLSGEIHVDVAIVGGGIVGIMAGTFLKEAGKTVAILEAGRVAEGVTGHTTAKITSLHTLIYDDLIDTLGEDKARLYAESNQAAIEIIRQLCVDRDLACDLSERTAYTYTTEDDYVSKIEKEAAAARSLGLPAQYHDEIPLPFPVKAAVGLTGQAEFHPRKFLLPLVAAIPGQGSHVFENTRVADVEEASPCRVVTEAGTTVTADDVVIATNIPIVNKGLFFARAEPSRGYALAMEVPQDRVPDGMFINIGGPTHSVRQAPHDGQRVDPRRRGSPRRRGGQPQGPLASTRGVGAQGSGSIEGHLPVVNPGLLLPRQGAVHRRDGAWKRAPLHCDGLQCVGNDKRCRVRSSSGRLDHRLPQPLGRAVRPRPHQHEIASFVREEGRSRRQATDW